MFSNICLAGFLSFLKTSIFVVGYISGGTLFPEPLRAEEEKEALLKMKDGDVEARNLLIERNLRLVAHVCKKYSNTNVDQDDLLSIGTIGLIKGIKSFDVDKGARLSTYVSRCIDNEILMYLRSIKKLNAEVYLNDTIGKDKDDNVVTLEEVLENDERSIEDVVDLKMKWSSIYEEWPSDVDFIEKATPNFIDQEHFMVFLTSVTTHQPYTVSSEFGDKNLKEFKPVLNLLKEEKK